MGWFVIFYFKKHSKSNRKQNKALTCTKVQRKSSLAWLKNTILFCFLSHYIIVIKQSFRLLSKPMMIRPSGVCLTNLKMCHTFTLEKNGISTYPNQYCICDDKNSKASYSTFASAPHPYVIFTIVPKYFFSFTFQVNLYFMYDYIWYFRCTS